jgi:hypothetical protein
VLQETVLQEPSSQRIALKTEQLCCVSLVAVRTLYGLSDQFTFHFRQRDSTRRQLDLALSIGLFFCGCYLWL